MFQRKKVGIIMKKRITRTNRIAVRWNYFIQRGANFRKRFVWSHFYVYYYV